MKKLDKMKVSMYVSLIVMLFWGIFIECVTINAETVTGEQGEISVENYVESTSAPETTPKITPIKKLETAKETLTTTTGTAVANLRLIFTTDLHGQITTTNYENGDILKEGSIARANTLIQQARQEKGTSNTLLFDVGDVLYDYSTDYIYERDNSAEQPIYKAMATMGYDAITLGNHEFDYELTYVQTQLYNAGLADLCVLSNVTYVNTGKHVWNANKIIQKRLQTEDGKFIDVKVGVIGETIPTLSKKRTNHTSVLKTEDILENATKQAAELKAAGADIVVVLAHSGIGIEKPEKMADNVSYALTKISDVDVVLCGHLHRNFPNVENEQYYNLPGVDKETNLVNGKNLVMCADQGKYIGIADLKVKQEGERLQITDRKSELRSANDHVAIDEKLNTNSMGEWKQSLIANYSTVLAEIEKDEQYDNYFGTLEDTSVVQLVNKAKMKYALKYINSKDTTYKGRHVVGVSSYEKYGMSDSYNYIDFSNNFLQSYLSGIQRYKTALYLYKVTGAQLREWVEWTASAYETSSNSGDDSEKKLLLLRENLKQNVLQDEWENNWSNFFVFDGIEYTIDTTQEPRYDFNGNKVSDSNRVKKFTVNGIEIQDSDIFVVASNKVTESNALMKNIAKNKFHSSSDRCQVIVKEYIENVSMNGTLKKLQDNNWNVEFAENKNYIVSSGANSEKVAKKKEWIVESLSDEDNYRLYEADFSKKITEDVSGPNIVAAPLNTEITNKNITVIVEATDISGVAELKYEMGRHLSTSDVWNDATNISSGKFVCAENGVYSILAVDSKGNRSIYYVRINNINKSVLQAPIVNSYTNRKTKISGTAEANAKVYFELQNGKKYSTTVNSKGKFSYSLSPQQAGKVVYVYVVDKNGRASARTVVNVKRTGPNKPSVDTVKTNQKKVTGKVNDTYVTPLLLVDEKTVYVSEDGGEQLYRNSSLYNKEYRVVKTKIIVDSKGKFQVTLPRVLTADTLVQVYTLDSLVRNSLGKNTRVVQTIPNKPTIEQSKITNLTTRIGVYMDEKCSVYAQMNGKTYHTKNCKYDFDKKMYYYTVKIPKTNSGVVVKMYAINSKGKSTSVIMTKKEMAPNTPKLTKIKVNGKSIKGKVRFINTEGKDTSRDVSKTEVYVKIGKKKYKAKVRTDGTFVVKVKKMKKGTRVVYWASNVNGTGVKGVRILR